jgi:hypothetical protein
MKSLFETVSTPCLLAFALLAASPAGAITVVSVTTFASGTAVNATAPDSIALSDGSIWVAYTNGGSSTGGGVSTIVQYDIHGNVMNQYSVAGSVDGLKVDPYRGLVWCLQNQDGNSTLTFIQPGKGITPDSPYQFAVQSGSRGFDDVLFRNGQVFLSYTNPVNPTDPTIQLLQPHTNPIAVVPVLTMGATGTNLATGQTGQPTAQHDPDSLKLTLSGDLMLSSGDDGQLIFVQHPATSAQAVSFLQLLDPSGIPVSGLDDARFADSTQGTFYVADTNNNRILAIQATEIPYGSLYASIGSLNEFASVDLSTGIVTPVVSNLNAPHGVLFIAQ